MSKQALTRVWTVVSTVLVFYYVNTWLSSQGAEPILKLSLLDKRRVPGALLALVICPTLLIVGVWLAERYRGRFAGRYWHNRMPVVALDELDTGSTEGKLYQGFFLLVFKILPVLSLVHFANVVLSAPVHENGSELPLTVFAARWPGADRFRIGPSWKEGLTFFPIVEPVILGALAAGSSVYTAIYLFRLFRPSVQ